MENAQAAEKLSLFGDLLELEESTPFRSRAYHQAARSLSSLTQPFSELLNSGTLTALPGIGKGMAATLRELHDTGRIGELDALLGRIPPGVLEMRQVPGLGAKKLRQLYMERGISSLDQLEAACEDGSVAALPGFGAKSVSKLRAGIIQVRSHAGRWRRPQARRVSEGVALWLSAQPGVREVHQAGPLRREMETVGELAWIVVGEADPGGWVTSIAGLDDLEEARSTGSAGLTLRFSGGVTGEVRCVGAQASGSALLTATGPEAYVRFVREKAVGDFETEADMARAADVPLLPPECRDLERFWTAGAPPDLITFENLCGVLHCHSTYSDGRASLRDMVSHAASLGLTYFGVCDHSRSAAYAGGLSVERVQKQHEEILRLNEEFAGRIRIFKGIESDILGDGSLDYPDAVLASFDFVVASVHSGLDMDIQAATERVCRAIRNRYTTILGHATGRLLLERQGFPLDWEAVVAAAKEAGVVIELNANPRRLDVDWRNLPLLFEAGVPVAINPDAHTTSGLEDLRHGVAVARKAGARPAQVLNCMEVGALARYFEEARG